MKKALGFLANVILIGIIIKMILDILRMEKKDHRPIYLASLPEPEPAPSGYVPYRRKAAREEGPNYTPILLGLWPWTW